MSEHLVLTGVTGAIGLPLGVRSFPSDLRTSHCNRSLPGRRGDVACVPRGPQPRSGYYEAEALSLVTSHTQAWVFRNASPDRPLLR